MSAAPPEAGRAEMPQDAGRPARDRRKWQFYAALFVASIILISWQLARLPGAGFGPYWEPVGVARKRPPAASA